MATTCTTGQRFCDICNHRHITNHAIFWCPECDENYCEKCKSHHDVAKATKKHETISIENALKIPKVVQDIKINCTDHDERFVYFCREHEQPCCIKCLNDCHTGCRSLIPVETVIQDVKQSTSFLDLESTLSDLLSNISTIIEDRTANLKELVKQKVNCAENVRIFRASLNSYLDELEKNLTNKLQVTYKSKELEIQNSLADLELRKARVNEMQEHVNILRNSASEFQIFMSIPEYTKSAHSYETELQGLCENELFNWTNITLNPTNIMSIKDYLTSFGTISVKRKASNTPLKLQKTRQAQLTGARSVTRKLVTMQFEGKYRLHIPDGDSQHEIVDCNILPNDEFLFSDWGNKCLYKFCSGKAYKIGLPFSPIRFVIIDKGSIAVTTTNNVHVIDLKSSTILKTFLQGDNFKPRSILLENNTYIIEDQDKGYIVLDLNGRVVKRIPINYTNTCRRATVCLDENLYFVDYKSHTLFCYDLNGKKIWEFQNEKIKFPYDLTSNSSNILFVCGYGSHNVCAVSTDGKTIKEIVGPKTALKNPMTLHYCNKKKTLLVVSRDGDVFIYNDIS
ncbi:uncharacterized protein LOC127711629 [Mytilus californianus]|uniref:uncharacterized protein LOC127711629 n=1 Tax=Mytilus californianus TaxID=6549 RepID=UPI00224683D2|nr:uncharacterized protein LOC127711629 [Mytilus californianus]